MRFIELSRFTIQTEYFNSCYDSIIQERDYFDRPDLLSSITAWLAHIGSENKNQIPHLCIDLGLFTMDEMYQIREYFLQFALTSMPLLCRAR